MQLSLPLTEALSDAAGRLAEPQAIVFVRRRRARRYILRVLPDGTLRVTLPRWGVKRDAQAFVEHSRSWIARQLGGLGEARHASAADTSRLMVDGQQLAVRVEPLAGGVGVFCGDILIARSPAPPDDPAGIVKAWLRMRARRELPAMLLTLAAEHGISVARVSVRNQRSRWGACSPTGTITLNWRLIQAPPFVREYVLLHELMHRRELNHSRRFWRLVAACCPRHADARQWLRTEGKLLWSGCE